MTLGPATKRTRAAFTLIELLVTITIIGIVSGMALFAMFRAQQEARLARTRTQIAKINELMMQRWESYKVRSIPARFVPPTQNAAETSQNYRRRVQRERRLYRILALRDLMRMEMPDRISDIHDGPAIPGLASPSVRTAYLLQYKNTWTTTHQSSECLYLILSTLRDGESTALDFFRTDEIGDTDNDGMNEVLDGMGRPIYWLRWAPAFSTDPGPDGEWGVAGVDDNFDMVVDNNAEAGWDGSDDIKISQIQTRNAAESPDFFDILRTDPRWDPTPPNQFDPFGLYPLIYSGGEDKVYDIYQADENGSAIPISSPLPAIFRSVQTQLGGNPFPNDPYASPATAANLSAVLGTVMGSGAGDNIDNHNLEIRAD